MSIEVQVECLRKKMMNELDVVVEEIRLNNLSLNNFNEIYKDQIHMKLQLTCNFNSEFKCPCGCSNSGIINEC